ncbi:hypothetical protein ACHAWT_004250 [Skeletonema menzelii]
MIKGLLKNRKKKKTAPPVHPPTSINVGEGNSSHHDVDDGGSCSSDQSSSSEMSSLSEKYRRLEIRNLNRSAGSPQPPMHFINSLQKKSGASEEFEDDKANMVAKLMKNHSQDIALTLLERSSLIESIIRLSQHVPGCVIGRLLDDITRDRRERKDRLDRRRRRGGNISHSLHQSCKSNSSVIGDDHPQRAGSNPLTKSWVSTPSDYCEIGGDGSKSLPISRSRESALLFVDISGFTKLSTVLDVDSFSNCMNTYFEKVINQVASYGGDILKFAGDAIFCEWRVSSDEDEPFQTLEECVLQAATCAADIVGLCSDFNLVGNSGISRQSFRSSHTASSLRSSAGALDDLRSNLARSDSDSQVSHSPPGHKERRRPSGPERSPSVDTKRPSFKRRVSIEAPFTKRPSVESTLNVKCGVGVGHMAGVHVGDSISRREFLMLGDPIEQVALAEAAASHGEVFASPDAISYLAKMGTVLGDWEADAKYGRPTLIAVRGEKRFNPREEYNLRRGVGLPFECAKLQQHMDDFDFSELNWLKRMISLYVHPVAVDEEHESSSNVKHETDYERNAAAAELRSVYTCFISPKMDYCLTGNEEKDQKLFQRLNDIMTITTGLIDRAEGHLRQFIVDDKGIVLIFTFGLRGSTFPNMIAQRAIPLTFTICQSLQDELGIKVAAGATFERAYCGVVGGINRHEFAVLGPAVNLAARLMSPKHNSNVILVDKNVRLLTNQIFFRPLPAVKAKGYSDPVPIFQPMRISNEQQGSKWGHAKKKFVGRSSEIKQILHVAQEMTLTRMTSKFLFMTASSGTGKSSLMVQATESVRAMKMKKRVIVTRYISNEGDSRIPFSLFRSIFKDLLRQIQQDDEASMNSSKEGSDFEIDKEWDSLSLQSHSTKSSLMSNDATRFRYVCEELNAPPEFAEVVGKRLLGLKSTAGPSTAGKPPDLNKIVNFMADAFIRCTKHADLVLLALDDVHWMDEMSWKVVQEIFERSDNVLTFCGSRPPSTNHLEVDEKFWSELHGAYKEEGRYLEINLGLFSETDALEMIAYHLDVSVEDIDGSFLRNLFTSSRGMPHYLSYVLETIKRNDLTVKLDNGLIGLKSSESAENALDSSVRTTLHLAAVLGMEFDLLDAALSYEEVCGVKNADRFSAAMELCAHFDVAEKEGIIERVLSSAKHDQDEFGDPVDEEDRLCESLEDVTATPSARKSHPLCSDNRRYRFTHDSWKTSILSVMLASRKEEMHEQIATVLEREIVEETESKDDLEKQITVFKHWNLSGNFIKAAELALQIGGQLMILGLNSQADLLFTDVITSLKNEQEGVTHGGICSSVLDAVEPSELELLIKLFIGKGKALCNLAKGKAGAEAYQSALDILHYTPCAFAPEFDRSVSFPIFSGSFLVLKMGVIEQNEGGSYEVGLCKQFVEQARLNNDPVHYGRALAMQGETLARLGKFEEALENLETIKSIYDIETQHAAICKAYGSDRVGQAFSHSVNWNHALGRTDAALATCKYIVDEIVPKSDPKNAHNTFCLLYSVIVTMKEHDKALEARDLFIATIVAPFEEHFGSGGSTFTKPMWQPILMVLDLQGNGDKEIEHIDEYLDWAMDDSSYALKSVIEGAMGNFSATPLAMFAEVPFYLAQRKEVDLEKRKHLIQTACTQMEKSLKNAEKCIPYAKWYAQEKLVAIRALSMELDCIDSTAT